MPGTRALAAHHTQTPQFAACLRYDGALAGVETVVERNHNPVPRLAQPVRESCIREQGAAAPAVAVSHEQRQPRLVFRIETTRCNQRQRIFLGLLAIFLIDAEKGGHRRLTLNRFRQPAAPQTAGQGVDQSAQPLRTHPGPRQSTIVRGAFQFLQRRDAKLFVQEVRQLPSDARQTGEQTLRIDVPPLRTQRAELSGPDQPLDRVRQTGADARQFFQTGPAFLLDHLGQPALLCQHGRRPSAIRTHSVDVRVLSLQVRRVIVQLVCDGCVIHDALAVRVLHSLLLYTCTVKRKGRSFPRGGASQTARSQAEPGNERSVARSGALSCEESGNL